MGKLCGDCRPFSQFTDDEVAQCPGQWFVDLSDGSEVPACGLLGGVVAFDQIPADPPVRGKRRIIGVEVLNVDNPLIEQDK